MRWNVYETQEKQVYEIQDTNPRINSSSVIMGPHLKFIVCINYVHFKIWCFCNFYKSLPIYVTLLPNESLRRFAMRSRSTITSTSQLLL